MPPEGKHYILISPVRNEEAYLFDAIKSVVNQTIKPLEYILVDDGSTDGTLEIIKEAAKKYPFIHYVSRPDRGIRKVGPGVIEAFYDGYNAIKAKEYNFIGKIDGDLTFGSTYYEMLMKKFEEDSFLGAASGKLYLDLKDGKLIEERHADEMVVGGMQFYKRGCFDAMGGFVKQVMWDGIAFHRIRMLSYRTRSFKDEALRIFDHRIMGSSHKNIFHGRLRWGWGQYFMGTHPLYMVAIGIYRMFERPYVLGGMCIVLGYLKGFITRAKRYDYPGFLSSLHAWQFERMKLGKRLEKIPPPESSGNKTATKR